MSYNKTNWINDQTELSAENMNKIENGIAKSYTVNLIAISDTAPISGFEVGDRYYNTTDGYIYIAILAASIGWVIDTTMQAETGVLYTILDTQKLYAYDGETMVSVGGGGGGGIAVYPDEPEEDTKLYIEEEDLDGQYLPVDEDIYSTTETKTNKIWVDGKPIYRKVINFGALPDTSTKAVAHNISNLDTIIDYKALAKSTTATLPIPYMALTVSYGIYMYFDATNITVETGYNRSAYSMYVVLEYTKTN